MEKTIFRFITRYSLKQQLYILFLTAASWPALYMSLELPKIIINKAIGDSKGFPKTVLGYSFEQVPYLMLLCFAFLALVLISGWLKYYLNVYAGRVGEQMLRRLRFELYARILRFPLSHFKKVSPGEIIPQITSEVEPVGGFIGESFSTPAFQGGTLLVYLGFIFAQDIFLGLAAISLYPIQIYWIPKLQKKVNNLAKQRVRTVRALADKINESVSGVGEIRANDASYYERADVGRRLGRIYEIRFEIFKRKFMIKFINNFLAQLTPFFFYSIGGYFVIKGELTFGALVAVLAAYKDLSSPWKELLAFYQLKEDVKVKYEQVVEQFDPEGMFRLDLQLAEPGDIPKFQGDLSVSALSYTEDGRVRAIDGVGFTVPLDAHGGIIGTGSSGKEELTQLLARILEPTGGSVRVGPHKLADLPESVTGRRMAYVAAQPFLFTTTVRENLYYGLKHRATAPPQLTDDEKKAWDSYVMEARRAASPEDDPRADWVDYKSAGVPDRATLDRRAVDVLTMVDMAEDVYQFGLRGTIDPAADPALAEAVLRAREALRKRLAGEGQSELVEPFDIDKYNTNATLAENLLFGTPTNDGFDMDHLADHPYMLEVLDKAGLTDDLIAMGREVASTMVELFSGLPPGHEFFEQYSFIASDQLPDYTALVQRTARVAPKDMKAEDRARLLALPFKLIPARHRLGHLDEEMRRRILRARGLFAENLPEEFKNSIEFYDAQRYSATATLQDNILFGKVAYGQAQSIAKLSREIATVLDTLDLRPKVVQVGLNFPVGVAGSRLSGAQRQKLAIARAILKNPDIIILAEAINNVDGAGQARILKAVLEEFKGRSVIWALPRAKYGERFDRIIVMRAGKVMEQGTFKELDRDGTSLHDLLKAE